MVRHEGRIIFGTAKEPPAAGDIILHVLLERAACS
jgi:hypothetical protein